MDGLEHQFEATDTDLNGQPLREADLKQLHLIKTQLPDTLTLKESCRFVLRCNLNISQGWVNRTLCKVLSVMSNCILVCKLGFPEERYPITKTKQKIEIKGAIVMLNEHFFATGQAYVALSRVRRLQDLSLWDFNPCAIKLAPYYQQLLKWCNSVDIIKVPTYSGKPIRYPSREFDAVSCEDLLLDELFDFNEYVASPSSTACSKEMCIDKNAI